MAGETLKPGEEQLTVKDVPDEVLEVLASLQEKMINNGFDLLEISIDHFETSAKLRTYPVRKDVDGFDPNVAWYNRSHQVKRD